MGNWPDQTQPEVRRHHGDLDGDGGVVTSDDTPL